MKVLKFGGTSVGSSEALTRVKEIVLSQEQGAVVVVSAMDGITDMLLATAKRASVGDASYMDLLDAIAHRHLEMAASLEVDPCVEAALTGALERMIDELAMICRGVYLVGDLSRKTSDAILSYGERMSSTIVEGMLARAKLHDARKFIKTVRRNGVDSLDADVTVELVKAEFAAMVSSDAVDIVPGFISSDSETGDTTNLGRGGADYTAAIIAAAIGAEALEIWTDVDGFQTADPKVIPGAYTIPQLSYIEAMELCNFGAKVIYPPTIYPVCIKHIPIFVKNIFNPSGTGTVISDHASCDDRLIKGISSISGSTLITVTGLSMVGVIGVNRRIFSALADNGISVFMVSQASSENSTSIAVRDEDASEAVKVLDREFAKEIATGAMFPMHAECGLATVAIVGENMKHTPGIAGKLFGTLGRSGISVIACAQGASETNISFVVHGGSLRKALNVLHDSFFLSEYKELNLFICGVGTVGRKLLEQIALQQTELMRTHRLKLNVVGVASSKRALFCREGIELASWEQQLDVAPDITTESMLEAVVKMNIFNSVFVDCTASASVAAIYGELLRHNISVVAANKIAASGPYVEYAHLKELALTRGVKFLYETNVGAGLPIIGTINDLRSSGDRILKIEAVLSGTLNFIFNALSSTVPFSEAVRLAKELGYSEPDPRIDLSGQDVVRKLVILTRESGYAVEQGEVEKRLFIPSELFDGNEEEFWRRLPELNEDFERRRLLLEREGKRWRFVASMEHGRMSVELRSVDSRHPFYPLEGSNNIVLLTTERYREYPMMIQGYGAGADVTAAGVFANIISISNN